MKPKANLEHQAWAKTVSSFMVFIMANLIFEGRNQKRKDPELSQLFRTTDVLMTSFCGNTEASEPWAVGMAAASAALAAGAPCAASAKRGVEAALAVGRQQGT